MGLHFLRKYWIYSPVNEKYICFQSPERAHFVTRLYLLKLTFDQFYRNGFGGVFLGGVGCILLFVWFFLYSFAYTRLWRIWINAND